MQVTFLNAPGIDPDPFKRSMKLILGCILTEGNYLGIAWAIMLRPNDAFGSGGEQ